MEAGSLERLGEFYLAPGYSTEFMAAFLATDLRHNPLDADEDEVLSIERIPVKKAFELALSGKLPDAKSLAVLLLARSHLEKYLG
jgi:ADP-ribose pyrophosphatase